MEILDIVDENGIPTGEQQIPHCIFSEELEMVKVQAEKELNFQR